MGIHGLFKELGPGTRISLAKLSSDHYTTHSRPLRLAVDISIWLFQIQSGKGGSNPALRTFYYRLLRLLTLNIHPLFVFDGPNKPEWKRGKKVGGPGVRVASVPEFLAKQLLKQFGFPWHVAPGEAEAECALLQREGVVDAVMSEDVDTLMFGSGVTLKNWSAEGSTKSPTHVTVYREEETKGKSGLDNDGMILVALMSGGDYIPTGIAGCGPKVACDAARAGFGKSLCQLKRRDVEGLKQWKEDLMHEVRTNVSKYFSRKNNSFCIPDDFPNWEVLGYYTRPCVSSAEKIRQMKESVKWDQEIDFAALRDFAADAFNWRCVGGAKKFIKNLAPAMLVRELRLKSKQPETMDQSTQEERELALVHAIHGKRNHFSADGELEYRITFTPANLVPIDLSLEEEDDQFTPAGGGVMDSDAESDFMMITSSTPAPDETASEPASPSKKRNFRPYFPDQPEKVWLLRSFLQLGCPLLVETYETPIQDPKEFLKARRKAKAGARRGENIQAVKKTSRTKKTKTGDVQENALMQYTRVTKAREADRSALQELSQGVAQKSEARPPLGEDLDHVVSAFKMPSTQAPAPTTTRPNSALSSTQTAQRPASLQPDPARPFAAFAAMRTQPAPTNGPKAQQRTPRKSQKRRLPDLSSPAMSQRTITSYYSPSPRKARVGNWIAETIDLVSSSPMRAEPNRPQTPSPGNTRFRFSRTSLQQNGAESEGDLDLPATVTKRRRRGPLKRARTAPAAAAELQSEEEDQRPLPTPTSDKGPLQDQIVEITSSSPMKVDLGQANEGPELEGEELPSPAFLLGLRPQLGGGFLFDGDATPKATRGANAMRRSTSPGSLSGHLDVDLHPGGSAGIENWLESAELSAPPLASQSSLPSPPADEPHLPDTMSFKQSGPTSQRSNPQQRVDLPATSHRRSPRQPQAAAQNLSHPHQDRSKPKKKLILPRTSLAGAWKEIPADSVEALDLTGDGSGWKASGGRAKLEGKRTGVFRKSGVEVLDLTGA